VGQHVADIFCCAYLTTRVRDSACYKALRVAAWNVCGHCLKEKKRKEKRRKKHKIEVEMESRSDALGLG
jgi:hypothetical protein